MSCFKWVSLLECKTRMLFYLQDPIWRLFEVLILPLRLLSSESVFQRTEFKTRCWWDEMRWDEVMQPVNPLVIIRGRTLKTAWMLSFPLFYSMHTESGRWHIHSTLCLLLNTFQQTQAKTLYHSNTNSYFQWKAIAVTERESISCVGRSVPSSEHSCCQDG